MEAETGHLLLRIYLADHSDGGPTCRQVVEMLRDGGLAGATVLKGIAGFGRSSRIHTGAILRLSEDLPLAVECVDTAPNIEAVLPVLLAMVPGAVITTAPVQVHTPASDPE